MENGMAVETATVGREGAVGANAGLDLGFARTGLSCRWRAQLRGSLAAEFQAASRQEYIT